jgi:aminoglycoside phosphotransferase (APT) family kinase protein
VRKIGQGDKSEVFALPEGGILKLFWPHHAALAPVEYDLSRALVCAGVSAPGVERLLDVAGRPGLVFEGLPVGETLSQAVRARPWAILAAAHDLADLHAAVHERSSSELPSQRDRLETEIRESDAVTEAARRAALAELEGLPDGSAVCHMDVHMLNVIVHGGGTVLIDWVLAVRGNPLADVATAVLQLRFGEYPRGLVARSALALGRAVFWRAYLRRYLERRNVDAASVARWELPVAVGLAGRRAGRMRRQLQHRIDTLMANRRAA